MTRQDSGDRLAIAHEHLVRAVGQLATSEEWRRMLTIAARFPTYSANNVLLIGVQRPDATRVAGIRTWNALGRYVTKGEKGIAILAPCLYRPRPNEPEPAARRAENPGSPETEMSRKPRGFRVAYVFDVLQTAGKPLADVGPAELRGAAPPELVARLSATLTEDGYAVERGPCGPPGAQAYGYTDFRSRTVRVRDDVDDAQVAKTLAHELGHVRAEHEPRFLATYATSRGCRAQAEVEAESIAYVVTTAAGMDTDPYSVPYLAGWSGGDPEPLRAAATRVLSAARGIVADLGLVPSEPVPGQPPAAAVEPPVQTSTRDPISR